MASRSRLFINSIRRFSDQSGTISSTTVTPAIKTNVPGLSESILSRPKEQVGPGVDPDKTGDYKVPEYFCYNTMSYYEAEIEMSKFRLPQPSATKN